MTAESGDGPRRILTAVGRPVRRIAESLKSFTGIQSIHSSDVGPTLGGVDNLIRLSSGEIRKEERQYPFKLYSKQAELRDLLNETPNALTLDHLSQLLRADKEDCEREVDLYQRRKNTKDKARSMTDVRFFENMARVVDRVSRGEKVGWVERKTVGQFLETEMNIYADQSVRFLETARFVRTNSLNRSSTTREDWYYNFEYERARDTEFVYKTLLNRYRSSVSESKDDPGMNGSAKAYQAISNELRVGGHTPLRDLSLNLIITDSRIGIYGPGRTDDLRADILEHTLVGLQGQIETWNKAFDNVRSNFYMGEPKGDLPAREERNPTRALEELVERSQWREILDMYEKNRSTGHQGTEVAINTLIEHGLLPGDKKDLLDLAFTAQYSSEELQFRPYLRVPMNDDGSRYLDPRDSGPLSDIISEKESLLQELGFTSEGVSLDDLWSGAKQVGLKNGEPDYFQALKDYFEMRYGDNLVKVTVPNERVTSLLGLRSENLPGVTAEIRRDGATGDFDILLHFSTQALKDSFIGQ